MTRTRRAAAVLLTLAVPTLGLVVTAAPAQAAAPVTVTDAATVYAGNAVEVQPLDNDTDADGDDLAICRVADSTYKRVDILSPGFNEDGEVDDTLLLIAKPSARPGTYTFTYYACDFQTLVAGTITLTVGETPDIVAKALPGQPGKIKVKNPADFKIVFVYGSFEQEAPDGQVRIPRGSSVVLKVRRTQIDWIAVKQRGKQFLDQGTITGIKLPPGTTPPASGQPESQRLAALWARGA